MISFGRYFEMIMEDVMLSQISPKELGLSSSMVRLPMSAPYGFWMDRHGNYIVVSGEQVHKLIASQILQKAGIHLNPKDSVYDYLLKAGWIRIVINRPTKTLLYEPWPGSFPTSPQKRNMEFMKDFYDLRSVEAG